MSTDSVPAVRIRLFEVTLVVSTGWLKVTLSGVSTATALPVGAIWVTVKVPTSAASATGNSVGVPRGVVSLPSTVVSSSVSLSVGSVKVTYSSS